MNEKDIFDLVGQRTKYAMKCFNILSNILLTIQQNPLTFKNKPECIDHYTGYALRGFKLFNTGKFDSEGLLESDEWDKEYNFRYSYKSIYGTFCELMTHVIRNGEGGHTKSYPYINSNKTTEIHGGDGYVENPVKGWRKSFVVQVKSLQYSIENGVECIVVDTHNHLKNKYDGYVDRLVYVDVNKPCFYEVNYDYFKEEVLDIDNSIPGLVIKRDSEKVYVSIQKLKELAKLKRKSNPKNHNHINFTTHG